MIKIDIFTIEDIAKICSPGTHFLSALLFKETLIKFCLKQTKHDSPKLKPPAKAKLSISPCCIGKIYIHTKRKYM